MTFHNRAAIVLRNDQEVAVDNIVAEFAFADRATLVMACGTGKTIVGLVAADRLTKGRDAAILCLFPSLALIKQTIEVWQEKNTWGQRFRFIAVCSDKGVVDDDINPEAIPGDVTTSAQDIVEFLDKTDSINVVFSTYQSSPIVADAIAQAGGVLDLALFDEAHRTAGKPEKDFALALIDSGLPIRKRLFMTATPRVTNRRKRDREGVAQVISMDDTALYGRVAHRLSFRHAVELGIICPYKILVSTVNRTELGDISLLDDAQILEATNRISLAKAIEKVGAHKIITFHPTIGAAQAFTEGAKDVIDGFDILHVNGSLPSGERHQRMNRFAAAARGIITNARCLTEGVDIPAIDMVAFIGRKTSKIDIAQAIGRAQRKVPGSDKQLGYVLLPLLIDLDANQSVEEALTNNGMEIIWDVLTALRDEDEQFETAVSNAVRQRGRTRNVPSGYLEANLTVIGDKVSAVQRAIEIVALNELSHPFDLGFGNLLAYVNREGHAMVPTTHVENGFPLGIWASSRRQEYKNGRLSDNHVRDLEALPGWAWNSFDRGVYAYLSFHARERHGRVPRGHVELRVRLEAFIKNYCWHYKAGSLSKDCVQTLEALPNWSWNCGIDEDEIFRLGIKAYLAFYALEGHGRLKVDRRQVDHVECDFQLRAWVRECRKNYRDGHLSDDHIRALEALPDWSWKPIGSGTV